MNKFYVVLGDWSSDGHGKSDKVLIESNIDLKELQEAYKKSCKSTGIAFHHDNEITKLMLCVKFEDCQISKEVYQKLVELKCPFDKMMIDGVGEDEVTEENFDELYINEESFINLLMWFIGLSIPKKFEWKKVEDNIPVFNGYWQDNDMNFQMGYGLYN